MSQQDPIPSHFSCFTRLPILCPVCEKYSNTANEYMREHVRRHLKAWICIICEQDPRPAHHNQGQSGSPTDFRSHWRYSHEQAYGQLSALSDVPCRVQYGEELELKSQFFFANNGSVPSFKDLKLYIPGGIPTRSVASLEVPVENMHSHQSYPETSMGSTASHNKTRRSNEYENSTKKTIPEIYQIKDAPILKSAKKYTRIQKSEYSEGKRLTTGNIRLSEDHIQKWNRLLDFIHKNVFSSASADESSFSLRLIFTLMGNSKFPTYSLPVLLMYVKQEEDFRKLNRALKEHNQDLREPFDDLIIYLSQSSSIGDEPNHNKSILELTQVASDAINAMNLDFELEGDKLEGEKDESMSSEILELLKNIGSRLPMDSSDDKYFRHAEFIGGETVEKANFETTKHILEESQPHEAILSQRKPMKSFLKSTDNQLIVDDKSLAAEEELGVATEGKWWQCVCGRYFYDPTTDLIKENIYDDSQISVLGKMTSKSTGVSGGSRGNHSNNDLFNPINKHNWIFITFDFFPRFFLSLLPLTLPFSVIIITGLITLARYLGHFCSIAIFLPLFLNIILSILTLSVTIAMVYASFEEGNQALVMTNMEKPEAESPKNSECTDASDDKSSSASKTAYQEGSSSGSNTTEAEKDIISGLHRRSHRRSDSESGGSEGDPKTAQTNSDTTTETLRGLWLLSLFDNNETGGNYVCVHVDVQLKNKIAPVFQELREKYHRISSAWKRFIQLHEVVAIQYVIFRVYPIFGKTYAGVVDPNAWPPELDSSTWDYDLQYVQNNRKRPPMPQQQLMHIWRNPYHADPETYRNFLKNGKWYQKLLDWAKQYLHKRINIPGDPESNRNDLLSSTRNNTCYFIRRVPKKIGPQIRIDQDTDDNQDTQDAWGLRFQEDFQLHRALFFGLLIYAIFSVSVLSWLFYKYGFVIPDNPIPFIAISAWAVSFFALFINVWFKWGENRCRDFK